MGSVVHAGSRIYIPAIYVINKIDQITIEELDVMDKLPHYCPVRARAVPCDRPHRFGLTTPTCLPRQPSPAQPMLREVAPPVLESCRCLRPCSLLTCPSALTARRCVHFTNGT